MTIAIKQDGRDVSARYPTLAELNGILEAPRAPLAYKAIAKACCIVPTLGELTKAKPACGPALGMLIVTASGLLADVVVVEEDDIPADVAEAVVAAEAKGFANLLTLRTEVGGIVRYFVQRMAKEGDVDKYLRSETMEAAKTLVETITVYPTAEMGGTAALQQEAPGLYMPLAKAALRHAGMLDEIQLGE